MTKSERLFQITSLLLRRKFAVTASELATRYAVSLRTIYRDISALQRQGVPVEGEAGVGYVLRRGYKLPPVAFADDEIDALVLGLRWVVANGDTALGEASVAALGKISAMAESTVETLSRSAGLVFEQQHQALVDDDLIRCLRQSIRNQTKIRILYRSESGDLTDRIIWPFAIGYFKTTRLVAAWCELRSDFRTFRADRVLEWHISRAKIPVSQNKLYDDWRRREGLSPSQSGF